MKQNSPLISMIVPIYRIERYVGICIESLIHQTYENIEIILVDDKSPDQTTILILREWAKKDARVKLLEKEVNGGEPRLDGIKIARGEYIVMADQDDWMPKDAIEKIKGSFVYFISTFATTAFGALNTVLVGIFMTPSDVAYWSVCSVVVTAVQSMYNPLLNSLYPHMIKNKSKKLLKKTMLLFMPIVTLGCVIAFIWSEPILTLIFGTEYSVAASLFRYLIPLLFISFPSQLYGWPALGAIDKAKEISGSTVIAALVQIAGLVLLIMFDRFTFINLAIVRIISELSMLVIRYSYYRKYKHLYAQGG